MSMSDAIYRPFERLVRPLEVPIGPLPANGPVALVLHFILMFRRVLSVLLLCSIALETIGVSMVWGVSIIVDQVTQHGAEVFLRRDWPGLVCFGLLIFPGMPIVSFLVKTLSSHTLGIGIPAAVQWQGHKAIERQDLSFFHDVYAGQVASRLQQVASAVLQQIVVAFQTIPRFALQMVGAVVLLTTLSWPLVLPVLFWIAANVALAIKMAPIFTETSRNSAKQRSLVVGAITDFYSNMLMIKQFAIEDDEAGVIKSVIRMSVRTQYREQRIYCTLEVAVVTLTALLWVTELWIGLSGLLKGYLTIGEFVGTVYLINRLAGNSFGFLQIGQQIFQSLGVIKDAMPVISASPSITDPPDAVNLIVTDGEIRFKNISFAYQSGRPVINDLSLTIRSREKVGLVGLSGAGKTTLINLLLRLYEIQSGSILVDNQDISTIKQESLRRSIGVIAQDVALLHRSVSDNIRYGRPEAVQMDIEQAAKMASADTFIDELADSEGRRGYEAFLGDRGIKLSGGQRQRVAIARVLLKNAPILILDEATSALDSESEASIQERLDLVMDGKTVIVIAHRLSTIARMDRIVVLDGGLIAESGKPEALIAQDGLFARLWKLQTGGFLPETVDYEIRPQRTSGNRYGGC